MVSEIKPRQPISQHSPPNQTPWVKTTGHFYLKSIRLTVNIMKMMKYTKITDVYMAENRYRLQKCLTTSTLKNAPGGPGYTLDLW